MALTDEDKKWLEGFLEGVEARFSERIERTETRLLTAFHKWAQPVDLRLSSHSAALHAGC